MNRTTTQLSAAPKPEDERQRVTGSCGRGTGGSPTFVLRLSSSKPLRRGFAMLELFVVLIILSAVAVLATHLFSGSMRLIAGTAKAQTDRSRFDAIEHSLRSDIWASPAIDVRGPHTLRLRSPDGDPIIWTINTDGSLARFEEPALPSMSEQHWPTPGMRLSFATANGGVDLIAAPSGPSAGERIRMVSPMQISAAEPAREKTP